MLVVEVVRSSQIGIYFEDRANRIDLRAGRDM